MEDASAVALSSNGPRKRALPTPPPKINSDELYRYVLRCALLNTDAIGQASMGSASAHSTGAACGAGGSAATSHTTRPSTRPQSWGKGSAQRVNAFLSELLLQSSSSGPIGSSDPNRVLTKEFLRKFRKRFTRVMEGKRKVLAMSDPHIAQALTKFASVTMKQPAFKDRMQRNCTVSFLCAEFINYCGDHALVSPMDYIHVVVDEAIDCLKYECVGLPYVRAMVQQFESYLQDMQAKVQAGQESNDAPPLSPGSPPAHLTQMDIHADSNSGDNGDVYFHDRDGLVAWTRQVFGINMEEHERVVRSIRAGCNAKVAIEDLKRCLAATEHDQHPTAKPDDFGDADVYAVWKKREIQQLNQLIAHSVTADPRLLHSSAAGLGASANSTGYAPGQQREFVTAGAPGDNRLAEIRQQAYTFIPPDPHAFYKQLVMVCMVAELQFSGATPRDQRVLSARSLNLLKECGIRWRLGATFRDLALIDNLCLSLDKQMVCVEHVRDGIATMQKNAARNEYRSWSNPDKRYLFQIHVRLNRTLLRMLSASLNSPETTSVDELSPILFMLDDIHDDENFRMAHPNLQGCRNEVREAIEDTASERFTRFKTRLLRQTIDAPEVDQLLLVAEALQTETMRMTKRFPVPIIGEVDVAGVSLGVYLKYFILEMENMVYQPMEYADDGTPSERVFELYRSVLSLRDLYRRRCKDTPLQFDVASWFTRYVHGWLRATEEKTVQWVDSVIQQDPFTIVSEEMRHSSSVIDLFAIFQQQIDFLEQLRWPDNVQQAQFVTMLSKVFGRAVGKYCESMERLFVQDLVPTLPPQRQTTAVNARRVWFDYTRSADGKEGSSPTPVDLHPQSCVRLNNIEAVRFRYNELYDTLDVDEVAYLLSTNPQRKLPVDTANGPSVYIYTVKVVLAENLADCDQNGLSDPYVVLQSGEVELARTRVIQETLNPRWDETFEFRLSAAIEVLATVFDKDLVGGDDICGTAVFRLQPSLFSDYLAHDLWLELKPQGRLLVRVSMEGEKDDIRFHFGKAFRTLKRTQADMARMIVDEMSGYVRHCLSRKVLFRAMRNSHGALHQMTALFKGNTRDGRARPESVVSALDGDEALHPLIDYLDKNLFTLFNHLRPEVASMVFAKIWKEMLQNLENLLVPPLSDQPTTMKPLGDAEVTMVFTCLELLKTYFHGGDDGDGIALVTLESPKYHNLLAIRDMYSQPVEALITQYRNIAAQTSAGSQKRRNKSIIERRNLGTIRQLAKKKSEKGADLLDCILRVLRLRVAHKDARRFLTEALAHRTASTGHQPDRPLPPVPALPSAATHLAIPSVPPPSAG